MIAQLNFIHINIAYLFIAVPFQTDQSTVSTTNCLTVTINCMNITNGDFRVQLLYAFGSCRKLHLSDYAVLTTPVSTHSSCLPVASGTGDFCYRATLLYDDTIIDSIANLNFNTCSIADLQSFLGAGVSYQLDEVESGGNVSHLTTATLSCGSVAEDLSGASHTTCNDGVWDSTEIRSCSGIHIHIHVCI